MRWTIGLFALLLATPCQAAQFSFSGVADFRFVAPDASDRSWLDGGLGKLRYGRNDSNLQFAGAIAQGIVLLTPELLMSAVVRVDPRVRPGVDLLESFVRYRPVSTTRWRWSIKGGAFFAPFSLENSELGWSPYWTLTPSAINSWYGDELRTIGSEATLEWRSDSGTFTLLFAVFGLNDPAGVMMADRGWALGDTPTGLFEELRVPDATLVLHHETPPDTTPIFAEFDNRPGWYAGASWTAADQWLIEAFRYDNEADPGAHQDDYFAWRTKFWDIGASKQLGAFKLLAQAIIGNTEIAPSARFSATTDFDSAFALLGWEQDEWRVAVRAEEFHTRTYNTFGLSAATSEIGSAVTAAVSWLPNDWLKLTGELVAITSRRGERTLSGLNARQDETQFQLSARVYSD